MPIYAYRCSACGHAKDVLQKVSDPVLSACPACGADAFRKQLTAAGFQLKGSGWYATDFKGAAKTDAAKPADAKPGETAKTEAKSETKTDTKPSDSSSGGSPAAAGGCGASCACH
jgi:putative FmdB family regulatory protein